MSRKNKVKVIAIVGVILLLCIGVWNLTSFLVGKSYQSRQVVIEKELEKVKDKKEAPEEELSEETTTEDLSNIYLEEVEPHYMPGDVQLQEIEQ